MAVARVGELKQRNHLRDDAQRVRHETAERHAQHRVGQAPEPDVRRRAVRRRRPGYAALVLVKHARLVELPARCPEEVYTEEQQQRGGQEVAEALVEDDQGSVPGPLRLGPGRAQLSDHLHGFDEEAPEEEPQAGLEDVALGEDAVHPEGSAHRQPTADRHE